MHYQTFGNQFMIRLFLLLAASAGLLVGCRNEPATKPAAKESVPATVRKTIPVTGFDPEGEPEICLMSDGTLTVVFNFMPPSYAEDQEEKFADFEKQLEKAVGVPVHREDRLFFLIRNPANDTAEKIRAFLEGFRKNQRK